MGNSNILFGILLITVTSVLTQDDPLKTQKAAATKVTTDVENLLGELQMLLAKDTKLDEKEKVLHGKYTDAMNKIRGENTNFQNKLKVDFNKKLSDNEDALKKYIETKLVDEIFKRLFGSLISNIEKFKGRYDRDSAWLVRYISDTKKRVSGSLNAITPDKEAVEIKLESILSGTSGLNKVEKLKKIKELQNEFYNLAKQVQLNQFHEEEKQRSDGNSGIKQIRTRYTGEENYFSQTHSGNSFSAIHDHSNNIRTVGMGEFIGVLNGIEFRTRHNDYRLRMPSKTSSGYHETDWIPFPEVPQKVKDAGDVSAQAEEMREWFKAWHDQDFSVRDYRRYFKPLLVYLEGAWTVGNAGDKIDEPFESDRHHIDATSWLDLQEKVRFTSYTGTKSLLENLAHLPTKIIRFTDNRQPVLAQWNYRLLCHPLESDLPTKNLKLVLDPVSQKMKRLDDDKYRYSRAARFDIEGINVHGKREDGPMSYSFLDSIMEQIPGKDNYGANIEAKPFNAPEEVLYSANPLNKRKLNAGYYHRAYLQQDKEGKIVHAGQRGFSDRLYFAHSTQDRVAHVSYNMNRTDGTTERVNTKVSYAIPVEIIYLTPLHSWNPYNVKWDDKATGTGASDDPFTSIKGNQYYITPHLFFSGDEVETDAADTAKKGASFIRASNGTIKAVRASGTRIFFPPIPGIDGRSRQRYPVMPVFGEGSAIWKKLNAVEDAVNRHINKVKNGNKILSTGVSKADFTTPHHHTVEVPIEDYNMLMNGDIDTLKINALTANGHIHDLLITRRSGKKELYIKECGGKGPEAAHPDQVCLDHHENTLG